MSEENKARKIALNFKGDTKLLTCRRCFAVVEEEDIFCWSCGVRFIEDDLAYELEGLLKK